MKIPHNERTAEKICTCKNPNIESNNCIAFCKNCRKNIDTPPTQKEITDFNGTWDNETYVAEKKEIQYKIVHTLECNTRGGNNHMKKLWNDFINGKEYFNRIRKNKSVGDDEIYEWWSERMEIQKKEIYRHLRSKVVTLKDGMTVIHSDWLEDIKKI